MKTMLMLFIFSFLLGACVQEEDSSERECPEDANICLLLKEANSFQSKAFGNNSATIAEKMVKSAKIFIFNTGGSKLFEKLLSSGEIAQIGSTGITFTVPGLQSSTTYNCYVIINHGDVSASSVSDLQGITENDIVSYNGTWNSVADAANTPNRIGGFVMLGNASLVTTANLQDVQSVTVVVKRITAKLDVATSIDQTVFGSSPTSKYQGTVTIDSVKVVKTQATTLLIKTTPTTSTGGLALPKQSPNVITPNLSYQNRFYVFENGALAIGDRVTLYVYATYSNGSVNTPVLYPVEISTDGTGAIVRNGAYAINISITGLIGSSVTVTITLSDWETLVTQNSNAGS